MIGGGVVLLSGDRLPALLGMPAPNAELEQTVASLEARLAAAESAAKTEAPDALSAVTEKITRLEAAAAEVEALKSAQAQLTEEAKALAATVASGTENDKTAARLAKLESQLTTLESAASTEDGGGRIAQLAALTGKIADLEAALGGQIAALRESVPQDIERRLAVTAEASESAKSGSARIDRDLTQAKTELARLAQKIETIKADTERLDNAVTAAREETGRVASGLGEVRGQLDQQTNMFAKPADVAAAVTPVTGVDFQDRGQPGRCPEKRRGAPDQCGTHRRVAGTRQPEACDRPRPRLSPPNWRPSGPLRADGSRSNPSMPTRMAACWRWPI